jgi:hypothetical protein
MFWPPAYGQAASRNVSQSASGFSFSKKDDVTTLRCYHFVHFGLRRPIAIGRMGANRLKRVFPTKSKFGARGPIQSCSTLFSLNMS